MEVKRVFDIPKYQLDNHPLEVSFASKRNRKWFKTSTNDFLEITKKISKSLIKLGIKKNDKVGISSANRTEWCLIDIGVCQIGAIVVPIYPTVSQNTADYILTHSETKICFVDDQEVYEKVSNSKGKGKSLESIFAFNKIKDCDSFEQFLELGKNIDDNEVRKIADEVSENDTLTIIYTSGTTGVPKGVVLTHKNLISNIINSNKSLIVYPEEKSLSFLPLSHIYERMILYIYQINSVSIYFAESLETIAVDAQDVKPNIMTVVPRLLEKVFDKIMDKGKALKGIKKMLFFWAVDLGLKHTPYDKINWKLKIARKLIFSKWQAALGGNLRFMASGSAPLQTRLIRIFFAAGMPVAEGYGLTETSPVVSVNKLEKEGFRIGSVGQPIEGVQIKIENDGEILVKGDNVMKEYYKNKEATNEVFTEDGFFRTGDIGEINEGFLKITDRKKQLFKTSGGKYIAPQVIENEIKKSRFVEQLMVIGEGERFPAAIIQPNFLYLKDWCEIKKINVSTPKEMVSNQSIKDRVMQEIEIANQNFGKWEQIKKIHLVSDEWSIDNEELTPTLKIRRKVLMDKYKEEVIALFK